ncbi:MAG: DUF4382 domain-containing protein [Candidatus Micrarchaeota archaeon]
MRFPAFASLAAAFILLAGCTIPNPFARASPEPGPDSGFLVLEVVDAPLPGLLQLNVTLTDLYASTAGEGGWVLLSKSAKDFDLIALANRSAPWGRFPLAQGGYTKLRFRVSSVRALFGEKPKECYGLPFNQLPRSVCAPVLKKYSVKAPKSSVAVGSPFIVLAGQESRLILDIDARSLRIDLGSYSFSPLASLLTPEEFGARFFNPDCGDGFCQRVSCTGAGCPLVETPENCPQDCAAEPPAAPVAGNCVAHDGICCLESRPDTCSEALLLCDSGAPAVFKGCEYREGACFSLSECG